MMSSCDRFLEVQRGSYNGRSFLEHKVVIEYSNFSIGFPNMGSPVRRKPCHSHQSFFQREFSHTLITGKIEVQRGKQYHLFRTGQRPFMIKVIMTHSKVRLYTKAPFLCPSTRYDLL